MFNRERTTKLDDGILQLKIDTLNDSLAQCTNKLSTLQSKYIKEVNELKPNLDQKEAEVTKQYYYLHVGVKFFDFNSYIKQLPNSFKCSLLDTTF